MLLICFFFFFFKQKTAYEMRISDWSSDVCSSDLVVDISGSASRILLDSAAIGKLASSNDAAVAMAGQVGAQVKVRVGNVWLIASIRDQPLEARGEGLILAPIDFLGEGDEAKITARARQRVGQGKRVSVHLALGGLLI